MASNHGQLCRDLIGGSLQIKNQSVLDKDANLCVNDAKVRGDLKVKGLYKTKCGETLTSACSTFFTPITHNWKAVSAAVNVIEGDQGGPVYGQNGGGPDRPGQVMYTVPEGRQALLLSFAADRPDPEVAASYAVEDAEGKLYLIHARGEGNHHERFVYMEPGDKFLVWALPSLMGGSLNCAVTFVEFDKEVPDGCFYKILRLSSTSTTDSVEYTIPDGHSAVLCPNLLPAGEDGEDHSESIIYGRDGNSDTIRFNIVNCINGIDFVEPASLSDDDPFNTGNDRPRLTTFAAGDKFRLEIVSNDDNHLASITTALFVKPNPCVD
jgi:hypothetical protein